MNDEEMTALDMAVAKAISWTQWGPCDGLHWQDAEGSRALVGRTFSPTRNPADWGPLIERFYMDIMYAEWADGTAKWTAGVPVSKGYGPWVARDGATVGEAICRAVVAMGEEGKEIA